MRKCARRAGILFEELPSHSQSPYESLRELCGKMVFLPFVEIIGKIARDRFTMDHYTTIKRRGTLSFHQERGKMVILDDVLQAFYQYIQEPSGICFPP